MCCHPFFQEKSCAKCDEDIIDNLCIIFDLNDFSTANMDYQFVKNLIWLLSRHYPERLGICLVINAPVLFYGCWTVIKPWSRLVSFTYLLILLLMILVLALWGMHHCFAFLFLIPTIHEKNSKICRGSTFRPKTAPPQQNVEALQLKIFEW